MLVTVVVVATVAVVGTVAVVATVAVTVAVVGTKVQVVIATKVVEAVLATEEGAGVPVEVVVTKWVEVVAKVILLVILLQLINAGNFTAAHGATGDEQPEQSQKGYDTPDKPNQMPNFFPSRQSGPHLNAPLLRTTLNTAVEFFKLFFSVEIIWTHTNAYAWKVIANKPHYGKTDGIWKETSPEEIERLIAIVIYFGLVKVNTTYRYWSVKTIYHGLWAR